MFFGPNYKIIYIKKYKYYFKIIIIFINLCIEFYLKLMYLLIAKILFFFIFIQT